jgi:ribose transport system substrate-binding protein
MLRPSTVLKAASAAVALMLLTACAASSTESGASEASTQASASANAGQSAENSPTSSYDSSANFAALTAGTYGVVPTGGPAPATGKNIWVISYLQAFSSAAATAAGVEEAAQALGWDVTVFDAQGDPSKANDGINQAIAAGADAFVAIYWDCSAVKAGLLAAEEAGVVAIADEATDCEGEPLYDYIVSYEPGPDFYEGQTGEFIPYIGGWQRVLADYIAAKTDNQAKVVSFTLTDVAVTVIQNEALKEQLAQCTTCEILEEVQFVSADLGPALQEKAQQAFLKHPDVNAISVEADFVLTGGVIAALKSAGLYGKVVIGGGEGGSETLPLMKEYEGWWGFSSLPTAWEGWQAVDAANRIFNDQTPDPLSGMGYQIVDKEHNIPSGDAPQPMRDGEPIDFAAEYKAAWGVE